MQYSNDSVHSVAEVTNDLSKCCMKDVERSHTDKTSSIPVTRPPIQVPQNIQGANCLAASLFHVSILQLFTSMHNVSIAFKTSFSLSYMLARAFSAQFKFSKFGNLYQFTRQMSVVRSEPFHIFLQKW